MGEEQQVHPRWSVPAIERWPRSTRQQGVQQRKPGVRREAGPSVEGHGTAPPANEIGGRRLAGQGRELGQNPNGFLWRRLRRAQALTRLVDEVNAGPAHMA
jgi:hypothetical protein